jgi:hypothetical protein
MKNLKAGIQVATLLLFAATAWAGHAPAKQIASGLAGASGSAIGPDGALYVTEGAAGRISRVDRKTGAVTTFAEGLPESIIGIGGAIDLAFIGSTPYVLVTLVGPILGGNPGDINGIYRVDGPSSFTVVADIGDFSSNNLPPAWDLPIGLQYAIENYQDGFLVTDGNHNRVLYVTLDGNVSEFAAFDNIVPTGLAVSRRTVFMAQAGPVPHNPEDGKVLAFTPWSSDAIEVASGAPLLVDVEIGFGVFGLSQGEFEEGNPPSTPALPNTGALVRANWHGGFDVIADGLNMPTSFEIVGRKAYIVTLTGEVWRINNIYRPLRRHWWQRH